MSYLALDSNAWQRAELATEMTFDIADDRRSFHERLPGTIYDFLTRCDEEISELTNFHPNTPQRGCSHYQGKLVTVNPRSSAPHARCEGTSLRDYACVTLKKRRRKVRDKARVSPSIIKQRFISSPASTIFVVEDEDTFLSRETTTREILESNFSAYRSINYVVSMRSEANRKNIPSSAEQINRESRGGSVSRWRNYFLVNAKEEKKMQKRKVKMGRVIDGTRSTQYATVSRIYSPLFSVLLDPGNHIGMAGNRSSTTTDSGNEFRWAPIGLCPLPSSLVLPMRSYTLRKEYVSGRYITVHSHEQVRHDGN
ncbi:LOW QUALITY PROTEIN: hypothetical protein V1477_002753 [Vespula maculifrons]|uniref:Uncharacterized protein n=1 Tax=Vespula maculifrons TaxID=7453 RepID=A0ABD2CVH3_VESMC